MRKLSTQKGAFRSYCGTHGISAAHAEDLLEWFDAEHCALLTAALSRGEFESLLTAYNAELRDLQAAKTRRLAKKGVRKGRKAKIDKCDCLEKFLEAKKSQKPGEPWHVFKGEPRLERPWLYRTRSSRKANGDRQGYKPRRRSKGRVLVANGVMAG